MTRARTLSIALAQLDPVLGDIAGNVARLEAARSDAARQGADLVVYSELFLTGYPPEDLVRKPAFAAASRAATEGLAQRLGPGPAVLVGTLWPDGDKLYNAVALLDEGKLAEGISHFLGHPEPHEILVAGAVAEPPPHLQKRVELPWTANKVRDRETIQRQAPRQDVAANGNNGCGRAFIRQPVFTS